MCKQNKKLKQGNHDVYTKIQKPNKNNKRKRKHNFQQRKHQKNRNTKLLLEELYIITEYIQKANIQTQLERVSKELSVQVLKVNVSVKEPNLRRNRIQDQSLIQSTRMCSKGIKSKVQSTKEANMTQSGAKAPNLQTPRQKVS